VTDEQWLRTRKFLREIRRHWPGAKIVLRPGGLPEPMEYRLEKIHAAQLAEAPDRHVDGVAAQDNQQSARMNADRTARRVIKQQVRAYRRQGIVPAGGVSWTRREIAMGLHPHLRHLPQTVKDNSDDF
jgi:hypothetical protein